MRVLGQQQTLRFIQSFMNPLLHVIELEAWSLPGGQLDLEYGKAVLAPEMWEAGIAEDVFIGLSEVPDSIDCENLLWEIESGFTSEAEFQQFCKLRSLCCDVRDPLSASRFLEFLHGRSLAWVHVPDDGSAHSLIADIDRLLRAKGLLLRGDRFPASHVGGDG